MDVTDVCLIYTVIYCEQGATFEDASIRPLQVSLKLNPDFNTACITSFNMLLILVHKLQRLCGRFYCKV